MEGSEVEQPEEVNHRKRLDDWFDYKFLVVYQNTTNVERARKVLHRYQPTDEILEKIYEFVLADNRRRGIASRKGEFYPSPPNCYTFFHESRWMDKIPSQSDSTVRRFVVHHCECGQEAQHLYPFRGKHYCLKCYEERAHPEFKRQVYDNLCKHNLGKLKTETREEWMKRLREHGLKVIEKYYGNKSNSATRN